VKLESSFEVPAPPADALALLLDADRVIPCMPGAELVEVVDDRTWKAKLTVKLGPVGMDFTNDVKVVDIDEAAGHVRLAVSGRDTRGKGGAEATIDSRLVEIDGGGTRVDMETDLRFSGQAAQLGRPAVVKDVSTKLVEQFAACLRAQLSTSREAAAEAVQAAAKPISGFSLVLVAIKGMLARLFRRQPK
jgi:carbon monoxide dehydrogenase subunit G